MSNLIVATRSGHKVKEIRTILTHVPDLRVLDLVEAGIEGSPEEDGLEPYQTFEENALAKARYFFSMTGGPTVADDSGLEVDALDGAPGVHSKRFSPDQHLEGQALDTANLEHLVRVLGDRPPSERTARYVCVAALVTAEGEWTFRGAAPGIILGRPRGTGGFGYDPVFFDPELGMTFAEISDAAKNERSHRGAAFRRLADFLTIAKGS